ncbi:uncharacterized protein LOC112529202 [Cynara cardunculus var. scolymus]|uniref:DUF4378 domain-containing protein n=1 Tax=Cynara cardunculus var. scolymus TaxID=59895 RepID=A0A103YII9_CYNCS|nr:uncharacterized protein LOC112529202 [Cynara cardunculus var. scolymus]KVI09729.1 protein of unknown function DUF4378 [Cynara cardunculus var. scolymus]
MENSQNTPSVIAKLMGLDEMMPPWKQPISRQLRVLSDNYLQKSGSIGKRTRKDSQNNLLRSKKRANLRTNYSNEDISPKDLEQKSSNLDGIQGTESIKNGENASRSSFLVNPQTTFAWEAKKQLLERLKMTKVSQELRSSTQSSSLKSKPGSKFGGLIGISSKEGRTYKPVTKLPIFKLTNFSSNSTTKSLKITRSVDLKPSSVVNHMSTNIKKDNMVSNSSTPLSVSSNSDARTEMVGLSMQLQLLESESEENDMDPEMVTSSDDEKSCCTDENIKSVVSVGSKESRDFSYLLDVFDESGFEGGDVEIRFERWHSSECMGSPLVYERLEKKYGKQELWHKAERRLLFDRINAGMIEILRPLWSKPLRRKMTKNMWRRDAIEEELWILLASQENGVHDGVAQKAVGRGPWLGPEDELDSIVKEIETFLFDKLAAELICV